MITVEQLIKLGAKPEHAKIYADPLNKACIEFNIETNARICQFIAQVYVESGCLSKVSENLNYSAEGLMKNFKSKFKSYAEAKAIEHNQIEIARIVYSNRQGRGLIQLTGLANYQACSRGLGIAFVDNPYLLEQPVNAARSATWFFCMAISGNQIADEDSEEAVRKLTRKINGPALNGLQERINYWKKAKEIWK